MSRKRSLHFLPLWYLTSRNIYLPPFDHAWAAPMRLVQNAGIPNTQEKADLKAHISSETRNWRYRPQGHLARISRSIQNMVWFFKGIRSATMPKWSIRRMNNGIQKNISKAFQNSNASETKIYFFVSECKYLCVVFFLNVGIHNPLPPTTCSGCSSGNEFTFPGVCTFSFECWAIFKVAFSGVFAFYLCPWGRTGETVTANWRDRHSYLSIAIIPQM